MEGVLASDEFYPRFALKSVAFTNLSPRMQFMLGSDSSQISGSEIAQDTGVNMVTAVIDTAPTRTVRRGRVCLVDYKYEVYAIPVTIEGSHILKLEAFLKPNMFPPSFLLLVQFLVQYY